jgi:hypothetical protein
VTQETDIGILKSIWRKDESGLWTAHDMQSIYLKPRKDFERDYFKIEPEIGLLTQRPGSVFDNLFATFGTADFLVGQSIVPIVAWNDGDTEMRCIGTGFFISASGLLMTAGHVMRDPVDEEYTNLTQVGAKSFRMGGTLRFGIMLAINPAVRNAPFNIPQQLRDSSSIICPFEWVEHWGRRIESPLFHQKDGFKLEIDIAICKVKEAQMVGPYQPINIGQHNLKVGDRAVAIGYAEMKNIPINVGVGQAVKLPELIVSVGSVTNVYPDNMTEKQVPTPGPCFEFDAKIPGKMSGAPVFVGSGILAKGVVSGSYHPEKRSFGCLVSPVMSIKLRGGQSLIELMNSGNVGIAKIVGFGL